MIIENVNEGIDTVQSSVTYTLSSNVENLTLTGTTAINGTGNELANILTGNSNDNMLNGGIGADTLHGGLGNDTYMNVDIDDIIEEYYGEGTDTVLTGITYTLGNNIENLILIGTDAINGTGNTLDNVIIGNSNTNILTSGAGNDILDGGAGTDTMIGGLGNDTYVVDVLTDVVTENVGEGTDTIQASLNYTLGSNQNIENLTLIGIDAINGTGNEFDNVLTGNSNTNILTGRAGNDNYVVDNVVDVLIENASEGNDTVQTSVTYTLGANLENLTLIGKAAINGTGNELDNVLTGNSNDNILNGGAGVDAMYGGLGNDTYIIQEPCDIIYEYADQGTDTVMSSISYSISSNSITAYLENLTLTGSAIIDGSGNLMNNVLIGNSGANMLYGNGGNDTLDGGAGADRMVGGDDSDTYIVDNPGDEVIESPGSNAGWDMVKSSVSFTLGSNVEGLTLTGTSSINGTGNDLENHITGNSGNNILTAGNGGSWMDGGAGDDMLIGGANCDVMDGGTGADTMIGGLGKDGYKVDNIGDIIVEKANEGIDSVQSSISYTLGANVENLGLVGSNAINGTGNALDNILSGNSAVNTLTGGAGNDSYIIGDTGDIVVENANEGTDTVQAYITYTLGSNIENLTLEETGDINGTGNALDNVITGSNRNYYTHLGGNNILIGGAGNDTLTGNSGNDIYIYNRGDGQDIIDDLDLVSGADIMRFGTGIADTDISALRSGNNLVFKIIGSNDQVSFIDYYAAETVNVDGESLNHKVNSVQFANNVIWDQNMIQAAVDNQPLNRAPVVSTALPDKTAALGDIFSYTVPAATFTDPDAGDALSYSATLADGTALPPWLSFNASTQTFSGTPSALGTISVRVIAMDKGSLTVSDVFDLTVNVQDLTLTGTAGADTLNGGAGNDTLRGLAGNDTLNGKAGNDYLDGGAGADTMLGGVGNDTYVVDNTGDIVTENANEGTDTVQSSITYTLGSNVENMTLTGNSGINGTGNTLNNVLVGNSAANTLNGGTGADTLSGGLGDDIYVVDNVGDVITENGNEGTDLVQSNVTYTLLDYVENLTLTGSAAINGTGNILDNILTGNSAANTLTGGAGNDSLNGGTGADKMLGGLGNDTYIVDNTGDIITENANEGTDTVQSSITYTLGANVENLTFTGASAINGTGNTLDNILTGNSGANTLTGGAGNDTLNGGSGADKMLGGLGNDTYVVDNTGDVVTENANEGTDNVQSSITFTLGSNIENLTLTGTSAINGTGNTLNNVLIGNSAANTLNGGTDADTMSGGLGNDIYVIDNAGDIVTENANEGTDLVQSSVTYTLFDYIENLTLTGSAAINGTGNILDNVLTGNSGANTLTGGAGNDTLNGGTGADKMLGGSGNDIYVVDNTGDVVTENANEGTDTVQSSITYTLSSNVENLTLTGTSAINGTGNALDNVLIGNSAANTLTGGAGNDTLNGGAGADKMLGGLGNDTYVVDKSTDIVTENASEGTGTVQSGITYTLGSNVENLTLTGTSAINGTGNTLDNVLLGNSGINTLSGGTGNDILDGGLGSDILIGGAGNDIFVFDTALNSASNVDSITDFIAGLDKIKLDKNIFTALKDDGALSSAFFRASTNGVALDDNDYFLYNTTSGAFFYDADGNGQGVAVQFATLTTKPVVSAADFMIAS